MKRLKCSVLELAAFSSLDGPVSPRKCFSPFGFSSMPRKFLQTKLQPGVAAGLAGAAGGPAGATAGHVGAAIGLTRTAAALAGASKFLLEAEETGCACTTISVSLSFTNWRVTSKAEGPESS